jgi:hypothetical protein
MRALATKSCELTSFSCREESHERRESKILGQQWDVRDAVLFGRKRFGRAGPQIGPKYALKAAHATPIQLVGVNLTISTFQSGFYFIAKNLKAPSGRNVY